MKTAPLNAIVDGGLPETAPPNEISCIIVYGAAVSEDGPIVAAELKIGSATVVESFQGFPRPDRLNKFPNAHPAQRLFSGFAIAWSGSLSVGLVQVSLRFVVEGVGQAKSHSRWYDLGCIRVNRPRIRLRSGPAAQVAIAMATFNPAPELFFAQLESIRAQTHKDWTLVISDESTSQASRRAIATCVGQDSRITLIHGRRIGVVGNFQRALLELDRRCQFFALADQDDVWSPDKLKILTQLALQSGASLVYGGMRIVSVHGEILDQSSFTWRRRHAHSQDELILTNTVTGAASLGQMELLRTALPVPMFPSVFHDNWLAVVASNLSGILYSQHIIQDYVQHHNNVIGHNTLNDQNEAASLKEQEVMMSRLFCFPDLITEHPTEGERKHLISRLVSVLFALWPAAVGREIMSGAIAARTKICNTRIDLSNETIATNALARCKVPNAHDPRVHLNTAKWLATGMRALGYIAGNSNISRRIADGFEASCDREISENIRAKG